MKLDAATEESAVGSMIIGDLIKRLQRTSIDVNKKIDQEYSVGLQDRFMEKISRLYDDIQYYEDYIHNTSHITEQDRISLIDKLEICKLNIGACKDTLRIKGLERDYHEKKERCSFLDSELIQQRQCCEELRAKLREVETACEELEEQKICLKGASIIVAVHDDDNSSDHYMGFKETIGYRSLCNELLLDIDTKAIAFGTNRYYLAYTSSEGETKQLNSPETFEKAFTSSKWGMLGNKVISSLQLHVQARQDDEIKECQSDISKESHSSDKSDFVKISSHGAPQKQKDEDDDEDDEDDDLMMKRVETRLTMKSN